VAHYLCEYDPAWPLWFQSIAQYFQPRLANILRIEHIGSTSVIGMVAKPIIDVDLVVEDGSMTSALASIEQAGYIHLGDLGIVGREVFEPVSEHARSLPPRHLYACEASALELRKHLSFRDYLLAHPAHARCLSEMKRHLAFEQNLSRSAYIEAKAPYVSNLSDLALRWYAASQDG
jgi:GrpB-like predicted nucleotidyltransferase (UPF0157 family)